MSWSGVVAKGTPDGIFAGVKGMKMSPAGVRGCVFSAASWAATSTKRSRSSWSISVGAYLASRVGDEGGGSVSPSPDL